MKAKSLVSFLLCLMLVLTGCQALAQQTTTEETITVPEDRIEVQYWCTFTGAYGEFIQTTIDEFNASQDKYFVVKQYNGNYMEQLAKIQISKLEERPALCTGATEQVGTMKYSGLIRRMDEMLPADDTIVTELFGNLISTWGDEDGLVGYPLGNSMAILIFNADICEKAGVDPYSVTSMEVLYEASQKIVNGGYATMAVGTDHSGIYANYSLAIEGVHVLDKNNGKDGLAETVLTNQSPAKEMAEKYMEICQNMQKEGLWYPLGASWGGEVLPAFCSGEIAIVTGTIGGYARILNAWRDAYGEDAAHNFVLVPWVSVTKEGKREGMPASGTGVYVIENGDQESQEGAIEYLRYFCSNDVQSRWLQLSGYMPLTNAVLQDESYQAFLTEDRPEVFYLIDRQGLMGTDSFYPVNPIDTEWKAAWLGAVEKVTSDTSYDISLAVEEMTQELQDAIDIWNLTN